MLHGQAGKTDLMGVIHKYEIRTFWAALGLGLVPENRHNNTKPTTSLRPDGAEDVQVINLLTSELKPTVSLRPDGAEDVRVR